MVRSAGDVKAQGWGLIMAQNKFRVIRAELIVQRKRIHQIMAKDSTVARPDAFKIARQEIEGGTLTFDIDQEYDRLTGQMEAENA